MTLKCAKNVPELRRLLQKTRGVMCSQSDVFRCCLCGEETYSIIDFLHHKAQHAAPNAGICCEFCKISYTRHITLREHYRLKHKINLPSLPVPAKQNTSNKSVTKHNNVQSTDQGSASMADDTPSVADDTPSGSGSVQDNSKILTSDQSQQDSEEIKTVHVIVENGQIVQIPLSVLNVPIANDFDRSSKESQLPPVINSSEVNSVGHSEISGNPVDSHVTESVQESCDKFSENHTNSQTFRTIQDEFSLNVTKEVLQGSPEDFPLNTLNSETIGPVQTPVEEYSINHAHSKMQISHGEEFSMNSLNNDPVSGEDSSIIGINKETEMNSAENTNLESMKQTADKCVDLDSMQAGLNPLQSTENLCNMETDQCERQSVHIVVEKSDTSLPVDGNHLMETHLNRQLLDNQRILNVCGPDSDDTSDLKNCNSSSKSIATTKSGRAKKENIKDDFHFILMTDVPVIVGKALTYQKQIFRCIHCEFRTYWKSMLCQHMEVQHRDTLSIHQALQIKSVSTRDNQTVMKMSEYNSNKFLKCKDEKKRMRGVEKQDIIGIHTCPKCNKTFNRLRYLRKHLATHALEQKYLCDECGKAFKTQAYLKQHRKVHQKEPYRCSQCDFSSSSTTAIQAHRQIHNKKCVLCDICGAAYNARSTLNKHMKVHDPARKYACTFPGCTWRFLTEMMCKAHIKNHTSKGKFRCTRCDYVFRHKHHLQRHEASQHGIAVTKPDANKHSSDRDQDKNGNSLEQITDGETVNLIVDPDIDSNHLNLQNALQNSQLVIATDSEGNTYEMSTDIAMNVAYQTLLQGADGQTVDTQAILIPQSSDCSHIVLQETIAESPITETV